VYIQFIIHNHPITSRYINYAVDEALINKPTINQNVERKVPTFRYDKYNKEGDELISCLI